MHVCLVTSSRLPEVYGGEEKFTISFGSWLVNQKNEVTIVGCKLFGVKVIGKKDLPSVRSKLGSMEPRMLHLPRPMYKLGMLIISFLIALRVIATNAESRISIIHAQDTGYGGVAAVMSAKILRIPVVVSSHGLRVFILSKILKGVIGRLSLGFEYWLEAVTSRNANLIIPVSLSEENFFARLGVTRDKIKAIPVAVEVGSFRMNETVRQTVRGELGLQDDETAMGFVGRLSPEKNLLTLLDAFIKALEHSDKMKLLFIGGGVKENELRMIIHKKNVDDKIFFTGVRYDVNRLLSGLDVFVLPSYIEGCPMALLEAMAAGKAIIASNISSIREIVRHGKEALLVNPYKPDELERAILSLHNDRNLRANLGHRARERARLYDIDTVYKKIINVYAELIHCRENGGVFR